MSAPNPTIDVVDEVGLPSGYLAGVVAATQVQIDRDSGPIWGYGCTLSIQPSVRPGNYGAIWVANSDVAGALGYHTVTADGSPIAYVFYETTLQDGEDPAVDFSHEINEMLHDPQINLTVTNRATGWIYAGENSDAPEQVTYQINGINMSDFVLPAWFGQKNPTIIGAAQGPFDFLGKITDPFEILPGGYMSVKKHPWGRWLQIFGSTAAAGRFNPKRKWRAVVREKGTVKRSTR